MMCLFLASDWYENHSIMWCEEGVVISGLLMGLNAIDYNVHMKGEDFDRSVSGNNCYDCYYYAITKKEGKKKLLLVCARF